jgi:quercetin dioxygenase-like cupin family protein
MSPDQIDHILQLGDQAFAMASKIGGVLGPVLLSILWRNQHLNRKKLDETKTQLDENTDVTKGVKKVVDSMAVFRGMVTNGKQPHEGQMTEFTLPLPGHAYEKFTLSEGSPVMWKTEQTEHGRQARFVISGYATMGFHAHDVTEELEVVTGVLEIMTGSGKFHVGPGQIFASPPGEIHSVGFCGYGECIARWIEQESDNLTIRIYQ